MGTHLTVELIYYRIFIYFKEEVTKTVTRKYNNENSYVVQRYFV